MKKISSEWTTKAAAENEAKNRRAWMVTQFGRRSLKVKIRKAVNSVTNAPVWQVMI